MKTTTTNRLTRYGARRNLGLLDLGPLRLTALSYLAEASAQEKYEDMAEIIAYAREFGANDSDVQAALAV